MKKLFFTLTAIIVSTIGRGQSFEGIFKYDVSSASPGEFSLGIEHYGVLRIKGQNVFTTLISKREGQLEKIYLADSSKSYQVDHIKQRYVIMPDAFPSEFKVEKTTKTKKILGYVCTKYVGDSHTFWVTEDLPEIDCKTLAEDLSFLPCSQLDGIPLMIDAVLPNGSYTLKVTEITPRKMPDALYVLDKEYEIKRIKQ